MQLTIRWLPAILISVLCGCAAAPAESVKLSSTIGRDLVEIRKSHLFYINAFYDGLESHVNSAVDQIYAPSIISAALSGKSGEILFQRLEAGKGGGAEATDAVVFTSRFLQLARAAIESRRAEALKPIRAARNDALENADAAYAEITRGNSTVTAYLASLVRVRAAQDELFVQLGAPNIQETVARRLARFSDELDSLQNRAKDKDADLEKIKIEIEELLIDLRKK